jgi:hypothetical protein
MWINVQGTDLHKHINDEHLLTEQILACNDWFFFMKLEAILLEILSIRTDNSKI